MSQSLINDIPPELLCSVFDLLGHEDRMIAMTTCCQWYKVLSSARYLRLLILDLSKYINKKHDIDEVTHYPNISIRTVRDIVKTRNILLDRRVAQHLEELYLIGSYGLDTVFAEEGTVHLPKLRKLSVHSFSLNFQYNLRLVAPNLKCLEVVRKEHLRFYANYDGSLAQQFVDHVEELNVGNGNSYLFNADRTYTNLRRLKLTGCDASLFKEEVFRKYASRLTHLQLSVMNQESIMEVSQQLFTGGLRFFHFNTIYSLDYRVLAGLESLQQLSISEQGEDDQTPNDVKLVLPKLTKLKVNIIRTPRFVVKNLRALHVFIRRDITPFAEEIRTFVQSICLNLQVLVVDNIKSVESSFIIDQICTMKQLQSINFKYSTFNRQDLVRMFSEVKHLRRAWFVNCTVESLTKEEQHELLNELRTQFVDCAIIEETWGETD